MISVKRKNTKPKGFFEKLKEQRNQRKADRAKQTDRKTDILDVYKRQMQNWSTVCLI